MMHNQEVYYWVISNVILKPTPHTVYRVVEGSDDWQDTQNDFDPCSVNAGPFDYEDEAEEALFNMDLWYLEGMDTQILFDDLEYEEFVQDRIRKDLRAERRLRKLEEKKGGPTPETRRLLRQIQGKGV